MRTIALLLLFAVLLVPIVTLTYTAAISAYTTPTQEGQTQTTSTANHGIHGHPENLTPEINYFLHHEAGQ